MSLSFDASSLNPWVLDIGELVNLLVTDSQNQVVLQDEWFLNPWEHDGTRNIDGIPFRPSEVLTLVDLIMGPADDVPPALAGSSAGGVGLNWYPIAFKGSPSGVYLVTTKPDANYDADGDSATSGLVGAGLRKDITLGDYAVAFDAYLPMVALNALSGGAAALGRADGADSVDPIQFSATVQSPTPQTDGSVTFSAVQVLGQLSFGDGSSQSLSANYLDQDGKIVKTFTSAQDFFASAAVSFVNNILAQSQVNDFLRNPISQSTSATPGNVLCDWLTLLDGAGGTAYTVLTKSEFSDRFLDKSALNIALDLVTNVLSNLAQTDPIITIEGGGIYVVAVEGTDAGGDAYTDFGLNLRLPDFALGKAPSTTESAPKASATADTGTTPKLTLQFGKWLTSEDEYNDSWIARSEGSNTTKTPEITIPGLTVTLLRKDTAADSYSFHLGVALSSVGIDYVGTQSDPLINIYGFVMQGIELRGAASVDWDPGADDAFNWDLGGAVRFDGIGVPLGTEFGQASSEGNNAVAADNVSSGTGTGGGASAASTNAVNPAFSASGSYMTDGTIAIQLYDANDLPTDMVWFPVQAKFGPLFCEQLGVGWTQADYTATFGVDGGISAAGLSIELLHLSLGLPFTTLTDLSTYNLGLDGIGVTFKEGPINLSAALSYSDPGDDLPPVYEGTALIQMWRVSVSASGSYTTVNGSPSLFVFGMVNVPMGGIPAFFINGLSAGFGYNRSLTLPTIDKVDAYPLVSVMGQTPTPTATETLQMMEDYITPERGTYWLAGGLQWTTYEVVNTNAVMNVEFGNSFEIGLIGLSVLSTPKETSVKFAYGELGIEVALDMGNDALLVEAALSPNSYVIDPKFSISGGFAMDAWWGDSAQGGDFVISLGGYSAQVEVPDYYPKLDRLGVSASIGKLVSLSGSLYMALTPSNIMAGGNLDVSASELGAELWFSGSADLIMYWQPFYFDAHMAVSAGCRYTVSLFGASCSVGLEASGTFDLWSPEFGGEVALDFWFISLPISFGAARSDGATEPQDWDTFAGLLPPPAAPDPVPAAKLAVPLAPTSAVMAAATPETPDPSSAAEDGADLIQMSVQSGLIDFVTLGSGEPAWRVRPPFFSARIATALPLTEISFVDGTSGPVAVTTCDVATGLLPMQATITEANQMLAVLDINDAPMIAADWHVTPEYGDMPLAIWSPPTNDPPTDPATIADCLTGTGVLRLSHTNRPSGPPSFPAAAALRRHDVAGGEDGTLLVLNPDQGAQPVDGGPIPSADTITEIADINGTSAQSKRDAVFDALAALTVNAVSNGSLAAMAAAPQEVFNASPMRGSV